MRNHIIRRGAQGALWTPAAVTTELWLDASDAGTITLNSGAVSQWADKSGFGRHATQSVSTLRPTVDAASINGEDSILFDDADDGMVTGLNLASAGYAIIVCAKCNTTGGNRRLVQSSSYNCEIHPTRDWGVYGYNVYVENNVHRNHLDSQGQTGITILYGANLSTYEVRYNGSPVSVLTVTTRDWGGFTLGATGYHGEPAAANLCEIIVLYTVDMNILERIEGYLAHKWGIASRLPGGHPYKSFPP